MSRTVVTDNGRRFEFDLFHLDTCLPCYFQGYKTPVIAFPVGEGITIGQVAEEIDDDLNASWEHLTYDWPDGAEAAFTEEVFRGLLQDLACGLPEDHVLYGEGDFGGPYTEAEIEQLEDPYMYFALTVKELENYDD